MSVRKVKITNGDQEAYVLPESVSVWEDKGWTAHESEDTGASAGDARKSKSKSEPKSDSTE